MCLIFTNKLRKASKVLKIQSKSHNINKNKKKYFALKNQVKKFQDALIKENLKECGEVLLNSWKIKKKTNSQISNFKINFIENKISKCNPYGYKLLGAGNGGYFCVIANKQSQKKLKKQFKENFFKINFDFDGVKNINLTF